MTANATNGTNTYRKTATVVGAMYVAGMLIGIPATMLVQSILGRPDHLSIVPANSLLLSFAAIALLLTAAVDALHGILMYPITKQRGERPAVGYLGFRIIDATFLAVGVVFLLIQIPLGRAYVNAGAANSAFLQALSAISVQANLYAYNIAMTFLSVAGLILCSVLYRARLVPRALAVWGLVGYAIFLGGSVAELMGFNLSSMHTAPGGLWEVFTGVWLMVKGFNASAFTPRPIATGNVAGTLVALPEPA